MTLCVFVFCLSPVGVPSKLSDRSSWVLVWGILEPALQYVIRKFGYLQNKGTSLWNFLQTLDLRKFHHFTSLVTVCCQLSSTKVDAQCNELDRRQLAKLIILAMVSG